MAAIDGATFYEKELKPLGYKLRVEIIDYPGGVPGQRRLMLRRPSRR